MAHIWINAARRIEEKPSEKTHGFHKILNVNLRKVSPYRHRRAIIWCNIFRSELEPLELYHSTLRRTIYASILAKFWDYIVGKRRRCLLALHNITHIENTPVIWGSGIIFGSTALVRISSQAELNFCGICLSKTERQHIFLDTLTCISVTSAKILN